jgi:acyl-coenzyme A thioesterase PaaI-like protein
MSAPMTSFDLWKETWKLKGFGLLKIPMIFFCGPKVLRFDENEVCIRIPLNYRTRNHLNSMYFGTLCVGADVAGGLLAMREIQKRGNTVGLVFKDFHAEYLKRPEADVHFTSSDGPKMLELVKKAEESGERVEDVVTITATCPEKLGDEVVARFKLTISLKKKKQK